jgi:hypothetical protein
MVGRFAAVSIASLLFAPRPLEAVQADVDPTTGPMPKEVALLLTPKIPDAATHIISKAWKAWADTWTALVPEKMPGNGVDPDRSDLDHDVRLWIGIFQRQHGTTAKKTRGRAQKEIETYAWNGQRYELLKPP